MCALLVNAVFGILMGILVAAADVFVHWRVYHSTRVWRLGLRGEQRTNRLLRHTLERRGHRVLYARTVPGHGTADEIVVGPGGVWLVHNEAWSPDAEISHHGGKLFIDGRTQSKQVGALTARAEAAALAISGVAEVPVRVTPVLAVHGGRLVRTPFAADGIVFAPPLKLIRWMRRNPTAELSPDEVEAVTRAAVHALPIGGRSLSAAA
ncbi:NERD domain-containing protein [Actinomadura bangladeshensis]|uniref:NERD domain-containing protein n=1 Tax=Actinomadura bangladeshensis TaxID=453573 RepID=A0A4R4NTN6_9ACTN|nr:NERD domain-containing protein [Actinomadura bangladeshensis]